MMLGMVSGTTVSDVIISSDESGYYPTSKLNVSFTTDSDYEGQVTWLVDSNPLPFCIYHLM